MSGHSHYATIHRQKELNDAARGSIFSKLAREITLAVKQAGPSPDANFKLKVAMERAHAANMPKENIQRAIERASGAEALEEVTYEGFGPEGVAVIVEVATDNRNRTSQEIKNTFERGGGRLAGPGAVSFNFEPKGLVVVPKGENAEEQILKLIDLGAEDVEETTDGIEVYVSPDKLAETAGKLSAENIPTTSIELVKKPKTLVTLSDAAAAKKVLGLLDSLNEHEDVQKVFANLDIPDEVASLVSAS
jgi:YebC/PmpR family DNA-binding regulatory protein